LIKKWFYDHGIINSYSEFHSSDDPKLLREGLAIGFLISAISELIYGLTLGFVNPTGNISFIMLLMIASFGLSIYFKISAQQYSRKVIES